MTITDASNSLLMWVVVVVPCGMVCWGGPVMASHVAHWWDSPVRCLTSGWDPLADMDQWEAATWHTVLRWLNQGLSRGMLARGGCWAVGFFRSPNCTQGVLCPQIVPREILINSQPLINSFNLFYLVWIYFNSSTYSKFLKFSSKIPKFMVITLVILNSNFSSASLC
jgi:hypothetical protein